jgi:hypothetical protein
VTRCAQVAGFLSPQACESAAVGECARCGKAVCEAHAVLGEAGLVCRSCQIGAGTGPGALAALAAGAGLATLFTADDADAFEAAAVDDEPDDMTADLS